MPWNCARDPVLSPKNCPRPTSLRRTRTARPGDWPRRAAPPDRAPSASPRTPRRAFDGGAATPRPRRARARKEPAPGTSRGSSATARSPRPMPRTPSPTRDDAPRPRAAMGTGARARPPPCASRRGQPIRARARTRETSIRAPSERRRSSPVPRRRRRQVDRTLAEERALRRESRVPSLPCPRAGARRARITSRRIGRWGDTAERDRSYALATAYDFALLPFFGVAFFACDLAARTVFLPVSAPCEPAPFLAFPCRGFTG